MAVHLWIYQDIPQVPDKLCYRITPQNDLPDLVQNAVSLLKIPLALFPSLVRQIALQKVKELNSLDNKTGFFSKNAGFFSKLFSLF